MVKRKRNTSYGKRKRTRRSGRFTRKRKRYFPQRIGGFPKTRMAKLRYCTEFSLNPISNGWTSHVFRANDCNDPDLSGGGHQPIGFDQMMAAYDHFTVIGSKIRIISVSSGITNVNPSYFGLLLSDDGTRIASASNINHLMEYPGIMVSQGHGGYVWTRGHRQGNQITRKFSAKRFFGKKNIIGDSLYRGDASTTPTEGAFFEVFCASVAGNDAGQCDFRAIIDYIVVFTEPKPLAQS